MKLLLHFFGILILLWQGSTMAGQNLGAYTDYRGYFYVFDNGNRLLQETMPVKLNQVGGNCVLYADNADNFKAYYKGDKIDLADFIPSKIVTTDDLAAFYNNRILYVFDNGKVTRMPGWTGNFTVGDSLVGYFDDNANQYNVYYNGVLKPLPDVVDTTVRGGIIAGDNILAYVGLDGEFKAYFHDSVYDLGTNHVSKYQAGTNTIAYMDNYSQTFKVFYNGMIATLEPQAPKSFKVGDNLIAYVDAANNFKIFYKGNLLTVFSYAPDFYSVDDNVVPFGVDNVGFNVFYKGEIYKLESTNPSSYQCDFNSVGYLDSYGYLKVFTDGATTQASEVIINKFRLTKNVLMYKTDMNEFTFFLNGKEY